MGLELLRQDRSDQQPITEIDAVFKLPACLGSETMVIWKRGAPRQGRGTDQRCGSRPHMLVLPCKMFLRTWALWGESPGWDVRPSWEYKIRQKIAKLPCSDRVVEIYDT